MKTRSLRTTLLLLLLLPGTATAYSIRDDATGGDCSSVGAWDAGAKTCTLSTDVSETIRVDSDAITLDGNGHVATATAECVILVNGRTGVTVRNLRVQNGTRGICVYFGRGNAVVGNIVGSPAEVGIALLSNGNDVADNVLDGGALGGNTGVYLWSYPWDQPGGGYNTIHGNTISRFGCGTFLDYTPENTFTNNTFDTNGRAVILNFNTTYLGGINRFYNNNFFSDSYQLYRTFLDGGTLLNLDRPIGGNYWSDNTACSDADLDGFCDSPFSPLPSEPLPVDNLPWTVPNGWLDDDGDGYNNALDCNDTEPSVHEPGAEIKHDGIDQDCNGYDLTIDVVKAVYKDQGDLLRVEATSALGAGANLQLAGFGPMTWDPSAVKWALNVKPAGGNPVTVTVSGVEGGETVPVTVQ